MDALTDLESLIARLIVPTKEDRNAAELRKIRQLIPALKAEITTGQEEHHRLMAENLRLQGRIGVLEQQLAQLTAAGVAAPRKPDEFIPHLGAIFVRKPGGRILNQPLCRQCRAPLRIVSADVPFTCSKCQLFALFRPAELNDVLITLRQQ